MRKSSTLFYRHALVFLFATLFSMLRLQAQTDYTIGTATGSNTGTSYPAPIQDYYEGSRAQYLYTAAELTAAGMGPGNIVALKFDVTSLNTFNGDIQEFTIKMGGTSTPSLSTASTVWEPASQVYGPVNYTPTVGINTFTLAVPFFWNGSDNIVVEICNGLPTNTADGIQHWTQNVSTPFTTGLSFNGSHTITDDDGGNLCGSTYNGPQGTATSRPVAMFSWVAAAACTGTPTPGSAASSNTNLCNSTTSFTLSITGATAASGLTYQWESSTDNITWSNITGATTSTHTVNSLSTNTYYRRKITCGTLSATSTSVLVTVSAPAYATLPFAESFENNWIDICADNDAPNNFWRNTPSTGNPSWRRVDDGASAGWTAPTGGAYTPVASAGNFSARFHTWFAPTGSKGRLDLHINAATAAVTKELKYDYINVSGSDSLVVYLSTNGGASFTRLDSTRIATTWRTKTIYFTSTSATTIIRFEATSDFSADYGLDNIFISDFPDCTGTPVPGAANALPSAVCSPTTPINLSITGATNAALLTFQWQSSIDGGTTWTNIAGATAATYTAPGISVPTQFRRITLCGASAANSAAAIVSTVPPAYTTLPFNESFENTWIDKCDVREIPNNFWRNNPLTGNPSWRRNDDGAAANWTAPASGAYSPAASNGSFSARFHSYNAPSGSLGQLDLFVNANTGVANKILTYDFINTNGNDSLTILISTNGGASFFRLDSAKTATAWRTKTLYFAATSATTVIRFQLRSDFGSTDFGLDNIQLADFPDCAGTPTAGTTVASNTAPCNSTTPFSLSVAGATVAANLTYQWQSSTDGGTTWTNITGATGATYNSTGISVPTQFRRVIFCGTNSANSTAISVAIGTVSYVALPYAESFENIWIDGCNTRDIPNQYWRNTPNTGNQSWRRNDDPNAAVWTNPTLGAYTPTASDGTYSARFHSYQGPAASKGRFDLYVNASSPAPLKRLTFDFINTSGTDSLSILISTNGGTSFVRLDSTGVASAWRTKSIIFPSNSATTILRFEATTDDGTTDIGLDNIVLIDWADCSGAPAGGTAISSVTNACADPFTLSFTGATSGNGISYQWQSAPAASGPWTDIAGATGFNFTTTQVGTTFYRVLTSCSFSGQSTGSSSVQVVSPTPVNGSFTINSSLPTTIPTNFNNFNDAYEFIKCGINGPVVFNVQNGIGYNEQLIMRPVPGANATNTVTFKGNGTAAIGFAASNTNERAVIKLRGTSFIIFDSLVINANTGTYGYGVQLVGDADSNIIRNCTINASDAVSTQNFAGIVVNGTDAGPIATGIVQADYNIFENNRINGGFAGITLVATFTGGANGYNQIVGNTIRNFYQYGIYVAGSYVTRIEYNIISRPTRAAVGDFNGIYLGAQKNIGAFISKNRIKDPFGGALASTNAFYGINFDNSDGSVGSENVVLNNLIYKVNGNGIAYGIQNIGSDEVYYLHNTVTIDSVASTSTAASRAFSQTTLASGIYFINNILSVTRGGAGAKHVIYLGNGLLTYADFNDYYINAAAGVNNIGFYGQNRLTLPDWRTATGHDAFSVSANPAFIGIASENYTPGNAGIDNMGIDVGITDDIIDAPRDPNTPDIGAYEFTPPPCSIPPVNGTTSLSASVICQNSPVYMTLNMGPYGSSQTFQWQTGPSATGPWTNLGTPMLTPDTTIMSDITQYYRVQVSCVTSSEYSDAVLLTVNAALPAGAYTINKNTPTTYNSLAPMAGTNFASFADAKTAMGCGILGAVVFNVVPGSGIYNEQFILDSIKGTSVVNTITFNGNGNTLAFASADPNQRAVIKLRGADYITFDSLRIDARGGAYGYGIQLMSFADSNTFRRNIIITDTVSTTTNYAGIVINATDAGPASTGTNGSDFNLFQNNRIIGGYYGITAVGATASSGFLRNNQFTGNSIEDFYFAGILFTGTANSLFEGNRISRPTRLSANTSVHGIYVNGTYSSSLILSKNRINDPFGGNPSQSSSIFYGINHNNVDAVAGNENIVSNNLFYDFNGNGAYYALYNTGSNNVRYYHNTIALEDISSTSTLATAGFYQTNSVTGLEFRNNIVTINRGGSGTRHAIYLNTSVSGITSDYNDLYVAGSGSNKHVGFLTANRTTLSAWQAASGNDANSLSLDPVYTDPASGNYAPQLLTIDNKGTYVNIDTDINNAARSTSTPDMGAYEFNAFPCTTPPVAGVATVTPNTTLCLEKPIQLTLTGHGQLGTLTFQWQHAQSATGPWSNVGPLMYTPTLDTVTSVNNFYRALVTCGTSTVTSNIVQVNLSALLNGTYTINASAPATYVPGVPGGNFQTWQSAVTEMSCGIAGPVTFNVTGTFNEQIRIPYVAGTSATTKVTFQSATGSPTDAGLSFASTTPTANYTLQLDSTRNFRFRNLTFTATDPANGRVIDIINGAANDSIINNIIIAPVTTSNTTAFAAIHANTTRGTGLIVKGNNISNGSSGIYFAGTSATAMAPAGNLIDSNFVRGAFGSAIDVRFANKMHITRNNVTMAESGAATGVVAGISTNTADSALRVTGNTVTFNNVTTVAAYGINIQGTRAVMTDSAIVNSNIISADNGNTGTIYGLGVNGSKGMSVVNNVISINSSGAVAYGLYNSNNVGPRINYFNNTINLGTTAANGHAGYFTQTAPGFVSVMNNIFSNAGGGMALFVNNPIAFAADYNMLYTTGTTLVKTSTGTPLVFPNLKTWTNTWNWDRYSISYPPAFVSATDLRPNLTNPDVWAMHGRGIQIRGNTYDFNYNNRPDAVVNGVPDLGAYEFLPTALPTVLLATPATPAPNTTQVFSYGTDTVQRITWGDIVPATVTVRRYSGVMPAGLTAGQQAMYFYTDIDVSGANTYQYSTRLNYLEPWLGTIPNENRLGLGRTLENGSWIVGSNSRVDVGKNELNQPSMAFLDKFTGLLFPFSMPELDDSSSNRGKDFWVAYQRAYEATGGNNQDMVLYFGAGPSAANVTVTIQNVGTGIPYSRTYFVPAESAIATAVGPSNADYMPKGLYGVGDARMILEGMHAGKGIHITSDVPIVAYAHIFAPANSGATMLMPTAVWGYEYYTLQTRQNYTTSNSHSAFYVVAQADSTWIEINPSNPTTAGWVANGGTQPNGSYLVKLNKGDAYQVLGAYQSGSEGYDLTGSYIKSIANAQGQCSPIAAFAGSTRTYTYCGTSAGGGDLIMQQIFPYQAWGNKYLTAPYHVGLTLSGATIQQTIYRIAVKDPTTVITRNGAPLGVPLVNNRYYQFLSSTADVIESNKPILMAQIMGSDGSCPPDASVGDPELIYISPLAQGVNQTQIFRNERDGIDVNFVTLVLPAEGLQTLRIDGVNYAAYPAADIYVYDHNNAPGYKVVTKRWGAGVGTSTISSDLPFTGIVYGEGSVESYGYNMGTKVRNLNNLGSVNNTLNTSTAATEYTCKGAPFTISALLPVKPTYIQWKLSALPKLSPNADTTVNNPVAVDTVNINGMDYYQYKLPNVYKLDSAGFFEIPITFHSLDVEKCDNIMEGKIYIQVMPAPVTDFTTVFSAGNTQACAGETATFTGDIVTTNGTALNQWNWTFSNAPNATGRVQTINYPTAGSYNVTLRGITADGCISDTTKTIVINARPVVTLTADSVTVCPGTPATFTIASPVAGTTYTYYSTSTGGTPLSSGPDYTISPDGTSFTVINPTPPMYFYVEGTNAAGCTSVSRTRMAIGQTQGLTAPVVTVGTRSANAVTFNWTAVTGAVSYQVSTDNGATWTNATGLSHTVSGLGVLSPATVIVRAMGSQPCLVGTSAPVSGCSDSPAGVAPTTLTVCAGSPATFNVSPVTSGSTYNWYTVATGGTALTSTGIYNIGASGTSFTVTPTSPASYYVDQQRGTCFSSARTQVTVNLTPNLTAPVVTADSIGINTIRFEWQPVAGATGYQVSIDGGTTWISPNSGTGPAALTHTVTNLLPMQTQTIQVRALGGCSPAVSAPFTQRTIGATVFIPNSFSPNGDGRNETMRVYSNIIQSMRFVIFNQWGEKIFETSDMSTGWDGRYKGKQQPSGVYMYVVDILLKDGTKTVRKGSVNLIR